MTPLEQMTKAIRKEFVDHIVDHANPHWGAQKPDHLVAAMKAAGYWDPEKAADFFAVAVARAALLALAECELPESATKSGVDAACDSDSAEDIQPTDRAFRAILHSIANEGKEDVTT